MANEALDRLLALLQQRTSEEIERKVIRRHHHHYAPPEPPPIKELEICRYCRQKETCKKDFPDITRSTYDGRVVTDCPHLLDSGEPIPDELCWICGKPNCDFKVQVISIQYKRPDYQHLLDYGYLYAKSELQMILQTVNEERTIKRVSVHDACYDIGEE